MKRKWKSKPETHHCSLYELPPDRFLRFIALPSGCSSTEQFRLVLRCYCVPLTNLKVDFWVAHFPSMKNIGDYNQEKTHNRKYPIAGAITYRYMRIESTYQIEH